MNNSYGSVPTPTADVQSLVTAVVAIQNALSVLTNNTKDSGSAAVTWNDLVALGQRFVNAVEYLSQKSGSLNNNVTWEEVAILMASWPEKT